MWLRLREPPAQPLTLEEFRKLRAFPVAGLVCEARMSVGMFAGEGKGYSLSSERGGLPRCFMEQLRRVRPAKQRKRREGRRGQPELEGSRRLVSRAVGLGRFQGGGPRLPHSLSEGGHDEVSLRSMSSPSSSERNNLQEVFSFFLLPLLRSSLFFENIPLPLFSPSLFFVPSAPLLFLFGCPPSFLSPPLFLFSSPSHPCLVGEVSGLEEGDGLRIGHVGQRHWA